MEIMDLPLQEAQPEAVAEENATAVTESDLAVPEPAAMPEDISEISGGETAPAVENDENIVPDVAIKVKFNKQERTYSAEEAAPLVEMGLKWESFRPHYEKLRYLALINEKSVGELIDGLLEESDSRLYSRIMQKTGDEAEAARVFEKEKKELEKRLEQLVQKEEESERQSMLEQKEEIEQRLANEFLLLAEEFSGQFGSFADVPEAVVECAVNENISLLDAYLRHQHREAKRIEAERIRQMELSARTAGSLSDSGIPPCYELDEFEQAFYKALQ